MKHALGALGVLAAGVLLAVSAAMNWRFGYSLGMTEVDKQIYGAASAAADCFKALVPFFFFAAIKNKVWSQAVASAILWVVVSVYSLTSALGHAALNRMDTNGQRAVDAASYKDLRNDLKRAQDQMSWIPQHRPIQTVTGEIETYKLQRQWVQTKSCSEVTGPQGRDFCGKYQGLLSELASADQAKKWDGVISDINTKLAQAKGTNAMAEADPQAAVLAKLASLVLPGIKTEDVQTALAVFVAVLLEIGSGFGMYVAFSTWRLYDVAAPSVPSTATSRTVELAPHPMHAAKPRLGVANDNKSSPKLIAPETDVIRFRNERIEESEGTSLTATTLYEDYCAWCEEQQKEPLALPTFGREFGDLGVQKAKIAGRVRYIGIALKSGAEHELEEDKKLPVTRAA
jgi:Poxvirus D5 protein-like